MSPASATPKLFAPLKVGKALLQHRVAMAPLTRLRNDKHHVPLDIVAEHFSQRGSSPGTLLVTDATYIAQKAGGYENAPGIYSEDQIKAWKKVTDAVHAKGSFIYLQLWALGRAARSQVLAKEAEDAGLPADAFPYVSASAIRMTGKEEDPRPLTVQEIEEYVDSYAQAAENAVHGAGFDGVEIHGANGYLIDQFIQDVTNKRSDAYGGSIEKRSKFALDVIDAVAARVGADRTGIRLSPFSRFQDMRMADPIPTYSYLLSEIRKRHPSFSYIHLIEGEEGDSLDFARNIWHEGRSNGVFLSCQNHTRESALKHAEEKGDVVVFGKWFISNPDLVRKLKEDLPLTPFDVSTFYSKMDPHGYVDYPFAAPAPASSKKVTVEQEVLAAAAEVATL